MRIRKTALSTAAILACLVLTYLVSSARRPVRLWHPDELVKESDVVVIATAQSTHDVGSSHVSSQGKSEDWIDVDTVFAVKAVLKGKEPGKTVTLHHLRYRNPQANITVVDGPVFVTFDSKTQYLLFLKRGAEGVFEPVTGQYDPDQSFNKLSSMLH